MNGYNSNPPPLPKRNPGMIEPTSSTAAMLSATLPPPRPEKSAKHGIEALLLSIAIEERSKGATLLNGVQSSQNNAGLSSTALQSAAQKPPEVNRNNKPALQPAPGNGAPKPDVSTHPALTRRM